MKQPPRLMQSAVIAMAILVLVLALWRLRSQPRFFGGLGPWAATNIFGASTLGLFPGNRRGADDGQPLPPLTLSTNQAAPSGTNSEAARPPRLADPVSARAVSTNLLNTNGPVTLIAADPSDLSETPSGVNTREAASLERRLGAVSAKGGDIQISLSWNNYNDLDLHCFDPAREEIYFINPKSISTGGELDIDQNRQQPYSASPVENIYWPAGGAPPGLYSISVVYYAQHCEINATPFLVRTVVRGRTNFFRSTIRYTGMRERKLVCNLRYDPSNPNPAQRCRFVP